MIATVRIFGGGGDIQVHLPVCELLATNLWLMNLQLSGVVSDTSSLRVYLHITVPRVSRSETGSTENLKILGP